MIKRLHIRNYAIIEHLDIDFAKGLTIITGETGAGKSILLGALGLIMGDRADTKSLYNQEEKCVIEGIFDLNGQDLSEFFAENDLDNETEVVVRRELTPSGKSRAFVNDSPVTLKVLQDLSAELIDLHQQFDTLDIHNLSFQLRMIDALAGNKERLLQYRNVYKEFSANQRRLDELLRRNEQSTKEMDFIQFQLEEFNKAELVAGELEALEEEHTRLTHAEDIKRTLGLAFDALTENEQSIVGQMQSLGNALITIGKYAPKLAEYSDRFANMIFELREMSNEFEKVAEHTEYDPERIQEVQQRLDLIYRLLKKHTVVTVEDLLAIQTNLEQQLAGFADLGNEIGALREKISTQQEQLYRWADELGDRRQAVIPDYEQKVVDMLTQLAMPYAQLKIETKKLEALSPTGLDEIQFMFAANRGSRLQQIKDVASGGELSRLALVTKSLVASSIPLPTLIFDEIDSGISGDVALKMGNILRQLSNEHQVVTITHSPQVASKADRHYFVFKVDKPDRTVTNVRLLSNEDRIRAIAVMLSQSPPSDSALENAKELLGL
ncbi:DNA repair protein RecN [Haliscomenobacter hydrossis]|uniref:DNA repair protein RecN n=1 Tax=Haliscomenobacter hydrossis (strain ATCC 27775 / DSM 1100 / LMG 10767 / O) TaxID=760192 RepID=F4KTE0_HALH1|nr:DNA repair protein RecN [Haliscomenobacter hydrossis]AEE52354.1 DNA repair protein RecN [Haliscomenobacter hydrossis DSM 1100]